MGNIVGNYDGTNGVMTLSVTSGTATLEQWQAALRAVTYRNSSDAPTTATARTISYVVNDGTADSTAVTSTVTVTAVNDAPTGLGNLTLASVNEDPASPPGAAISSLAGLIFADVDTSATLAGVAVVGNTLGSQGVWQYSTNSGTNWFAIGDVNDTTGALVLSVSTRVRFLPVANFNGTPTALTVRALDNSYAGGFSITGASETRVTVNTTTNGGTTAISANTNTIGTSITAVNDAPVASGSATLASVDEDTAGHTGSTVGTLFAGNFNDSRDDVAGGSIANSLKGVAITANAATAAQGKWQWSAGAMPWTDVPTSIAATTGLFLLDTTKLRFLPASDFNGTPGALTARLIDNSDTTSSNGTSISVSATGNTTAISAATVSLGTSINPVNESPVPGQSSIDLGSNGKLIKPVQVEGRWYYYWDRSGDGSNRDQGTLNGGVDTVDHNVLDGLFRQTRAELNTNTLGTGTNTTDLIRFTTLDGVKLALPTANGGLTVPTTPPGTNYTDANAGSTSNGTSSIYDDLLAIWDAYNGTGTGSNAGIPTDWQLNRYWSATAPSTTGHRAVNLNTGDASEILDTVNSHAVALQVLFPATFTASSYERITNTFRLTGTDMFSLGDAGVDIKNDITWSRFGYDTNGDNTVDVSFSIDDIASAKVVDATTLEVVLIAGITGRGADKLESATNFDRTSAAVGNADKLILTQNAAAGNSNAATLGVTQATSPAGLSEIDLGSGNGKLINPVRVEGKWYYAWDRNGDGLHNSTQVGGVFDYTSMDALEQTFFSGQAITETNRQFTLNGVTVLLPTDGNISSSTHFQTNNANGGTYNPASPGTSAATPGAGFYFATGTSGTAGAGTTTNVFYDDLLAIWDATNATATNSAAQGGQTYNGEPAGWQAVTYWSATPSASGHAVVNLNFGGVVDGTDSFNSSVVLQVL
jgi:hypothetical protein